MFLLLVSEHESDDDAVSELLRFPCRHSRDEGLRILRYCSACNSPVLGVQGLDIDLLKGLNYNMTTPGKLASTVQILRVLPGVLEWESSHELEMSTR